MFVPFVRACHRLVFFSTGTYFMLIYYFRFGYCVFFKFGKFPFLLHFLLPSACLFFASVRATDGPRPAPRRRSSGGGNSRLSSPTSRRGTASPPPQWSPPGSRWQSWHQSVKLGSGPLFWQLHFRCKLLLSGQHFTHLLHYITKIFTQLSYGTHCI